MWNLPGLGIKLVSPAFQGGFLTTGPLGKCIIQNFIEHYVLNTAPGIKDTVVTKTKSLPHGVSNLVVEKTVKRCEEAGSVGRRWRNMKQWKGRENWRARVALESSHLASGLSPAEGTVLPVSFLKGKRMWGGCLWAHKWAPALCGGLRARPVK